MCHRSPMFATISSSGRIPRSISTRGHAIENDWRLSISRAIVGNRATSGSDQRPMYDQSRWPATDGTTHRSLTERTINSGTRRRMVRSIVGGNARSHDQSQHRATDHTINHCYLRPTVRSIVAPNDLESQVRIGEHGHRPC